MRGAKVVDTPYQKHCLLKRWEFTYQGTSPADQTTDAGAKRPIEAFDVVHMRGCGALCLFYQGLYLLRCATNDTSDDTSFSLSCLKLAKISEYAASEPGNRACQVLISLTSCSN